MRTVRSWIDEEREGMSDWMKEAEEEETVAVGRVVGTDLRARGDVRSRKTDIRCPGNVSDPIGVLVNNILNDPLLVLLPRSAHSHIAGDRHQRTGPEG
jgi:hypothetical protein